MYVATYRARLLLSFLIVVGLMILLRRVSGRLRPSTTEDGGLAVGGAVVRTPFAVAILAGLLITVPLRPNPPYEFQQAMLVIVLAASACIVRPILTSRLARPLSTAFTLLVLIVASQIFEPSPRVEQLLLVVEMAAMAGLLLWVVRDVESTWSGNGDPSVLGVVVRAITYALALACAVSAVAAALGYLDLADFLGIGLLLALMLAIGLIGVRLALDDLITLVLTHGPIARLQTVVSYREVIGSRLRTTLDLLLIGLWTWMALGRFQLRGPVGDAVDGMLGASLRAGGLDLPVSHILAFVAVLVLMFAATRFLGIVLQEDVYSRMTLPRGVPYALSTLTRYVLLLGGFLLALGALGLDLTRITVLISALGLGLGFGLQQIMSNFVSGLILLFERPVQVGDSIQVGDLSGEVRRIGIRSSTLHTAQGADVIIPNSRMIEEKVVNWTLTDRGRRYDLELTVDGDVDVNGILTSIEDVARRDPRVNETPPPEALLVRLEGNTTHFELRYWTDDPDSMRVWSDLSVSLHRMLHSVRNGDARD
jgi:small-conductance mechanosensitive channel